MEALIDLIREHLSMQRLTTGIVALAFTVATFIMFRYYWFFTIPMFGVAAWAHEAMYNGYKEYRYIMTGVSSICYGVVALFIATFIYESTRRSIGIVIVIAAALITYVLTLYAQYREFKRSVAEDETLDVISLSTDKFGKITVAASTVFFLLFLVYWVMHFDLA